MRVYLDLATTQTHPEDVVVIGRVGPNQTSYIADGNQGRTDARMSSRGPPVRSGDVHGLLPAMAKSMRLMSRAPRRPRAHLQPSRRSTRIYRESSIRSWQPRSRTQVSLGRATQAKNYSFVGRYGDGFRPPRTGALPEERGLDWGARHQNIWATA